MDPATRNREAVTKLIQEYAALKPSYGDIEPVAVMDEERGHYEVLHVGWEGSRRVHGSVIHIDLIGDKIWIQYDGTSPGVAEELANEGIPRQSIVLGFRPPEVRRLTDFAVG